MTALTFEDVHTFAGNGDTYITTNESTAQWDELLDGLPPIYSAGGICSGGEVAFFNLLPRVRRKLVLVDHSYINMYFAIVKYLALQKYGPDTHDRFVAYSSYYAYGVTNPLGELAQELLNDVPETLIQGLGGRDPVRLIESKANSLQRFWAIQRKEPLIKTCAKLSRIKFVHGDLTDLAQFGKYDLLYLSNALESNHKNRDRVLSNAEKIAECVKPGGHVALSFSGSRYSRPPRVPENWEQMKHIHPSTRDSGELNWDYALYRVAA